MKQDMMKAVCFVVLTAIVAAVGVLLLFGCNGRLKKENELLRRELAMAQNYVPLSRDTIHDTVEVIKQKIVEVEKIKEVLSKEDKQLIKDLGMKVSELESLQKTGTVTKDTVILVEKDSTDDSPLVYHDAWTDIEYRDKRMVYAMRDSLAIALRKEYKHRFLFIRWGTKGYEVKVANFNPHSSVRYNTFVKKRR
jgi:hypothetical protein